MADSFDIRREREHYEVYVNGTFYCSADTSVEAAHEIEKYIEEKKQAAQLDWRRVVEHVRDTQYETYSPARLRTCNKLLDRYYKGERTKNLYEQMLVM